MILKIQLTPEYSILCRSIVAEWRLNMRDKKKKLLTKITAIVLVALMGISTFTLAIYFIIQLLF